MAKVKSLYVDAIFSGVSQCNLSIIKSVLLIILVSVKVLITELANYVLKGIYSLFGCLNVIMSWVYFGSFMQRILG